MSNNYVLFAQYNQAANKTILGILDKLSNDEREKDRGSYYKSLSSLFRHLGGGAVFFAGIFKAAVNNSATIKALSPLEKISLPKGDLSEAQWKQAAAAIETVDQALTDFTVALTDADLAALVTINWYGGNPAAVPLSFLLNQLITHGIHHRGQISQILDELKIDNNYSGIDIAFLPK
jgi:uncharacterized damage-inducible protein DinB